MLCASVCFRPDLWLETLETYILETWKTQFVYSSLLKIRSVVNVRVFSWLEISSHSAVNVHCASLYYNRYCRIVHRKIGDFAQILCLLCTYVLLTVHKFCMLFYADFWAFVDKLTCHHYYTVRQKCALFLQ